MLRFGAPLISILAAIRLVPMYRAQTVTRYTSPSAGSFQYGSVDAFLFTFVIHTNASTFQNIPKRFRPVKKSTNSIVKPSCELSYDFSVGGGLPTPIKRAWPIPHDKSYIHSTDQNNQYVANIMSVGWFCFVSFFSVVPTVLLG